MYACAGFNLRESVCLIVRDRSFRNIVGFSALLLRELYQEKHFRIYLATVIEMEHSFSVEMNSSRHLKQMSISQNHADHVLIEGNLGKFEKLTMIEEAVLVVQGSNGVMRIDLSQNDLKKLVLNEKSGKEKK